MERDSHRADVRAMATSPYCTVPCGMRPLPSEGPPPDWAMAAFCSWKRSPSRCEPFMFLSTHRMMQLSSRDVSDLLSKPLTQSSKQRWTRLEYIWRAGQRAARRRTGRRRPLTFMNSFICFFSMRVCSSRCSAGVSLARG